MAMFVNASKPLGASGGADLEARVKTLEDILVNLIDEINFCITHLGADNVLEATTAQTALAVSAENINTDNSKISSEQIDNILATKIVDEDGNPVIEFINGVAFFKGYAEYTE